MKLLQNEGRALIAGLILVGLICLSLRLQAAPLNPQASVSSIVIVTSIALKDSSVNFVYASAGDSSVILICGNDSLRRGRDFVSNDSVITLTAGQIACDTIRVVRFLNYDIIGRRYALHDFLSSTGDNEADLAPAPVTSSRELTAPTANLKVSGSKSFYADVSQKGQTNLSQGLALTLSGDIGRGVIVKGTFSDRGLRDNQMVTKRFSELDNVYLEVQSQHLNGVFGSYQLKEDRFRYLSMSRNVQGMGVKYHTGRATVESSVSVPPGNYTEYNFTTTDGFNGPYRLQGKNGESGIAVIENSETVWLNGATITRGRDHDYYLDYTRGELYFTGRTAIDNQDRVRVDFEYQRLEYRKTLVTGAVTDSLGDGKAQIGIGYAGLTAAGSDPQDFTLSETDIAALRSAGNDPTKAVVPGARSVGQGNGDYTMQVDSLSDTVFVYAGDRHGDYSVTFTQVDSGDYLYLGGGRYQFAGRGRGNYLPVRTLPMPEASQVVVAKSDYAPTGTLKLSTEVGVSSYDRNRFSTDGNSKNTTAAGFFGAAYASTSQKVKGNLSAEYLPAGFARLGRLDYVDENYLWQRQKQELSDRQRYLGDMTFSLGSHDRSKIEGGYTSEKSGFESRRAGVSTQLVQVANSKIGVDLSYASSKDLTGVESSFRDQAHLPARH